MESPEIIQSIAEMTEQLEPIPQIAPKVIEMVGNADTSCQELSAVISKDPALTSRILSLSNTPYYRRVESITSLNMAVMILGFGTIQSLVLTVSVGFMFRHPVARETLFKIWEHSVATALISELLGKRLGPSDQERYYIAGLLHDVGKLVFCKNFPEKFKETLTRSLSDNIPSSESEKMEFGFDHAQLGKAVLQRWNLPEVYHVPVANHHHLECAGSGEIISLLVHVADTIAHEMLRSEDQPKWLPDPVAMQRLRLDATDIGEIISQNSEVILENLELMANI